MIAVLLAPKKVNARQGIPPVLAHHVVGVPAPDRKIRDLTSHGCESWYIPDSTTIPQHPFRALRANFTGGAR
jgi:hypothetical protein